MKPSTYLTYYSHHLYHLISQILTQRNAWFKVAPVFIDRKYINNFEYLETSARK